MAIFSISKTELGLGLSSRCNLGCHLVSLGLSSKFGGTLAGLRGCCLMYLLSFGFLDVELHLQLSALFPQALSLQDI